MAHPVIANIVIIAVVAVLGLCIAYFSIAIFTRHGQHRTVPGVENMGYSQAVGLLHDKGFRVDIRDSIYRDDVKPGYVIEQFPKAGATVKPGRKIFLYINAVHPKEVVVDHDNHPAEDALKGFSFRQGMARLEELGFKNIKVVKVLGDNDRIVKVLANGKTIKKTQHVPVNARIVVEVYDGRLSELRDSLRDVEFIEAASVDYYGDENPDAVNETDFNEEEPSVPVSAEEEEEDEEPVFIQ